jgi:regulator of protease activity HflC (stomatin/prohibitin superfamily)
MTMPVPSVRIGGRTLLLGASIIAIAALASGTWYRVRQNEVAYVTRFGEADASAIRAKIEAAGGVDGYTRKLQAQAALNWKGGLPQIMGTEASTSSSSDNEQESECLAVCCGRSLRLSGQG